MANLRATIMKIQGLAIVLAVLACGCSGSVNTDRDATGDVLIVSDTMHSDLNHADRLNGDVFRDAADGSDDQIEPGDLVSADADSLESDSGSNDADVDAFQPADIMGDEGGDIGPVEQPCVRATACGAAATCNLCSGLCEERSPGWGSLEVLSAYPLQGASGDFIVVDGAGYSMFASATIGGVSVTSEKDENRAVVTRKDGATGTLKVGSASFSEQIETSSEYAGLQTCKPQDPPATGVIPVDPSEIGPYAVGFTDYNKSFSKVRIYYPATCGGLRRPPASGQFPFVMFMHGDGYIPMNFEYLARHLASWGFLTAVPADGDYSIMDKGRTSPQDWFAPLAGMATGGDAAIICHSKGAEYTHELGLSDVKAVVFLGPVFTSAIEDPYAMSLFPIQGLVLGWSEDGQVNTDKCYDVYEDLETPKYVVMIKRGTHGQFLDDKMWEPPSDGSGPYITRNRQHELTQAFTLAYLQRVFGQTESYSSWLAAPGLADELTFASDL